MRKLDNHLPALPETFRVAPPPLTLDAEFEPQPAHIPLAHYLWILRRHAWKIAAFVVATILATLIVSLRLTPIYESTVSIDIDRQVPTAVLGEEATRSATNDADQFIATQVKLIESDSVLRPVVDKYRLRQVEDDALEEAVDHSATSLEAPVILKAPEDHATAQHLHPADQLSLLQPPTGCGRGQRNRTVLSGA